MKLQTFNEVDPMNTTQKYLTRVKASNGGISGYRAALILGISHSAISAYQTGQRQMNDETATKMANYLGIDPVLVVAEVQLEGAKTRESRQLWSRILDLSTRVPALAVAAFALSEVCFHGVHFLA
jgi:plasmid maintenance system antidote protein VapI